MEQTKPRRPGAQGVMIFDHKLRPVYCNRMIESLCSSVCKKGACILEQPEHKIPELLRIVGKFREDILSLKRNKKRGNDLQPKSVIYLSPTGNFTIRCLQLERSSTKRRPLWQMILQEASLIHDDDFEVIDRKYGLTDRERDVFKFVVKGATVQEVSRSLAISNQTVKVHIHNIFRKMGVAHRSEILSLL